MWSGSKCDNVQAPNAVKFQMWVGSKCGQVPKFMVRFQMWSGSKCDNVPNLSQVPNMLHTRYQDSRPYGFGEDF